MSERLRTRPAAVLLSAGIVAVSLASGYIHFTLGNTATLLGLLFLANAAGYVTLAAAVLVAAAVRHPLVLRFGWAPRVALAATEPKISPDLDTCPACWAVRREDSFIGATPLRRRVESVEMRRVARGSGPARRPIGRPVGKPLA